jgi:fructokinase
VRASRRAVVVGEALVDRVHRVDGSVEELHGGSPANVALALARLGQSPQLVTSLAVDERGRRVREWLETSGVVVAAAEVPGARTSVATARLDASGAARYEFDIDWSVDTALADDSDLLHVGSIATVLEPGATDVARLVEQRRSTSTISFDPNIRPALVGDADSARERVNRMVALADVIKASDEDIRWLHPSRTALEVASEWHAAGAAIVVVTEGGDGAFAVAGCGVVRVPAEPVVVVDTVGAGDTFMAALVDGLISDGLVGAAKRKELHAISRERLAQLVRRCAAAAAITVSRRGTDPPLRSELPTPD